MRHPKSGGIDFDLASSGERYEPGHGARDGRDTHPSSANGTKSGQGQLKVFTAGSRRLRRPRRRGCGRYGLGPDNPHAAGAGGGQGGTGPRLDHPQGRAEAGPQFPQSEADTVLQAATIIFIFGVQKRAISREKRRTASRIRGHAGRRRRR